MKKLFLALKLVFIFLILIFQIGCSVPRVLGGGNSRVKKGTQIVKEAKKYIGTKYRYGGTDLKRGVDCSGLVYVIYRKYGIPLNRVSKDIAKNGKKISKSKLEIGDLVFFDTKGRNNREITHLGIYIKNGDFIHASSSKGVMISNLNTKYWKKTYVKSRRVIK